MPLTQMVVRDPKVEQATRGSLDVNATLVEGLTVHMLAARDTRREDAPWRPGHHPPPASVCPPQDTAWLHPPRDSPPTSWALLM